MKHLFVVAHPDDEILGAGAYIYERAKAGDEIGVMVLNTCDTTRYDECRTKIVDDLRVSQKIVGVKKTWLCEYRNHVRFRSSERRQPAGSSSVSFSDYSRIPGYRRRFRPSRTISNPSS